MQHIPPTSQSSEDEYLEPEERGLLPIGVYKAKLISIHEPRKPKTTRHPGMFILPLEFQINDVKVFKYFAGYMDMVMFMYDNRNRFIGKEYDVKVKHIVCETMKRMELQILRNQDFDS